VLCTIFQFEQISLMLYKFLVLLQKEIWIEFGLAWRMLLKSWQKKRTKMNRRKYDVFALENERVKQDCEESSSLFGGKSNGGLIFDKKTQRVPH